MIDLYYWTTPNGHKITIFLEETGLPYTVKPVNIGARRAVRARVPRDRAEQPHSGDRRSRAGRSAAAPLSLFESGAILLYLADKTGRCIPRDLRAPLGVHPVAVLADGGPRADGRAEPSFRHYAPEKIPVRDRPLRQRDGPPLRGARTSGSPTASSSPATIRSPTSRAIRGSSPSGSGRTSTTFPHLEALAGGDRGAPGGAARLRDRARRST